MPQYEKKQKITANLVRKYGEEHYRVLDDYEMMRLKCSGKVVPEGKMTENSKYIISYYIEKD
ncbi:hypothetical protein SEA_LIMPID_96 [Streptomyces phage Limpid]|uniref:Uncharacterized protein n=1 Tax=Streptomyces phage Limpid TaxID=2653770 RepID=A0A5Q2WNX0_9CAUD|nr:hypothetical protein SEA_LIMPID_96 [Streptomyces phage Limpid]